MQDRFNEISYTKADHVAIIRMEAPERLNGWSATMVSEIVECLLDVEADDETRVMILTGTGKGFCAGGDAKSIVGRYIDTQDGPRWAIDAALGQVVNVMPVLRKLDKPVIAAVNGVAAGAGFAVTLMSDIRVASHSARFVNVYMRRGTVPSMAPYYLPWVVGLSQACRLIFCDRVIDAFEAERIGLVNELVQDDQLMDTATDLAQRIAKNPLPALRRAKRCLMRAREGNFGVTRELALMANLVRDSELKTIRSQVHA